MPINTSTAIWSIYISNDFKSITAIIRASRIARNINVDLINSSVFINIRANNPTIISTIKFSYEILSSQYLHLPFRNKKLNIGTKSQACNLCPQDSQWLGGLIMLSPLIFRFITRFANDPNIAPKKNNTGYITFLEILRMHSLLD